MNHKSITVGDIWDFLYTDGTPIYWKDKVGIYHKITSMFHGTYEFIIEVASLTLEMDRSEVLYVVEQETCNHDFDAHEDIDADGKDILKLRCTICGRETSAKFNKGPVIFPQGPIEPPTIHEIMSDFGDKLAPQPTSSETDEGDTLPEAPRERVQGAIRQTATRPELIDDEPLAPTNAPVTPITLKLTETPAPAVRLTKKQLAALQFTAQRKERGVTSRQDIALIILRALEKRGYIEAIDCDPYERTDGNVDMVFVITSTGDDLLASLSQRPHS